MAMIPPERRSSSSSSDVPHAAGGPPRLNSNVGAPGVPLVTGPVSAGNTSSSMDGVLRDVDSDAVGSRSA